MNKSIANINKSKMVSWEDKINKPLAGLLKKKNGETQINKIRNKNREITTDIRDYYNQVCANKMDNLEKMYVFLAS